MTTRKGTIRFASAISGESDAAEAADEVFSSIQGQMEGREVDIVVLFAGAAHKNGLHHVNRLLKEIVNPKHSIGVTGGGVIGSGHELEHSEGLAAIAASLGDVRLRVFCQDDLNWPAVKANPGQLRRNLLGLGARGSGSLLGMEETEEGTEDEVEEPKAVLLFADPFSVPIVNFLPALNAAIPGTPIVGGLASGGVGPGENRLICDGEVLLEGTVGVVLSGDIGVETIVSQGCKAFGKPWVITKARHNLIQEIGGIAVMKAIQKMAEDMEERDRDLLQHGLFVGRVINEYKDRFGRGDFLIRNIVAADQQAGYLAVSDLVRVGQTIQFHVRDKETAKEDMELLLQAHALGGTPAGGILCTCNGRGKAMFEKPNAESKIISDALGSFPIAGFFAGGEIGPIGGENFLHGFTSSLLLFREGSD